jgi:hypothetical protein
LIADFLVSILYAAASTKRDLKVTLQPYPAGVGYIDSAREFVGFRSSDEISSGAAMILRTLDKLPRVSELCKIEPKELVAELNVIDPLLVPLLKWVLKSNYTMLFRLKPHQRIAQLKNYLQLSMVTACPESERIFASALAKAPGMHFF